ncbi:MAG: thioredoxin family protein [Bacteroidetes bacterium]|nr:MAG: thioredoxin family protein [Bacteroidota bacterium]
MKSFLRIFTLGALLFSMVATTLSAQSAGLKVGDIAPDFKLKDVSGKMISLSDYPDAKGFIVTFTCNTCPFAKMYEDRLIELHKKYADQGYPVIAINPNDPEVKPGDSFEAMVERAQEKNYPFRYLFDEGQKVYPAYGASRTPHIYLLDKNRKVRYIGALDNNAQDPESVTKHYVEDAIKALENGQEPDPAVTKAIGCSIKVKS